MTDRIAPPRCKCPPTVDDVADAHHRADLAAWSPTITVLMFALGVIVGHGIRLFGAVAS
jgi:hypothetical protein